MYRRLFVCKLFSCKACPGRNKKSIGSQLVFSWLRGGMADTMKSTKNRGLSCQQRNAQHHSNDTAEDPGSSRFSAERIFRETKETRSRNLDRRSPLQKAIQQNARKTANHIRGYRTEVLGKISELEVRTEISFESARQTLTQNWRQFPAQVAHCAPMGHGAEILSRGEFSTKFGVETKKINTAARRNQFYAKRRTERIK